MSALNPIISTYENPEKLDKESAQAKVLEKPESFIEIPAHFLQRAILSCNTKTELIVYLTILRYSLGFNRRKCTLSRRFIAQWTGLQFQNVGRGITGLIEKGLIKKLPESNAKKGDCFEILHFTEAKTPSQSENECNQNDYAKPTACIQPENTQGVINLITERNQIDAAESSKRLRSVISLSTKKKKEDLEESSSVSETLKTHIQNLPEPHLQKIERRSLQVLRNDFSDQQIEQAFHHARSEGTKSGEQIKLPLCYLSKGSSMKNILSLVVEQEAARQKHLKFQVSLEQSRAKEELLERQRKQNERHSVECFEREYPSQSAQLDYVNYFLEHRWKCKKITPSPNLARKLAIADWFKNKAKKIQNLGGKK